MARRLQVYNVTPRLLAYRASHFEAQLYKREGGEGKKRARCATTALHERVSAGSETIRWGLFALQQAVCWYLHVVLDRRAWCRPSVPQKAEL